MMSSSLPCEVTRVALRIFEGLSTPIGKAAAEMLRGSRWDDLASLEVDPRSYTDWASYYRDAVVVGLLRKNEDLPTSYDRKAAAMSKWRLGEVSCFHANNRLDRYLPEAENYLPSEKVSAVTEMFSECRKIIVGWIGNGPPSLVEGRFGPGATYSDRGGLTTTPHKVQNNPSLTPGAIYWLPQFFGTQWGSALAARQGELSFVPGNRFSTVPKTCKTDRAIAAEPSINVFYQLGLGRVLRRRLRDQAGWDLDTAQDVHRQVACESSVSQEFATLDLSNASDTVCRNLVRLLLPRLWFEALDDLRSKKTLVDGKWVVLEKFSSMGNGFTFELETIIFAALSAYASRKLGHQGELGKDVFVFGDDIIVKDDVVRTLTAILRFCGFDLNKEKSFFGDVPFRESCGGDFFAGQPVRPFFLKANPNGPEDLIVFANGLRRVRANLPEEDRGCIMRGWFAVLDSLPSWVRDCRGPEALGDLVIHDDEIRWRTRWRNSIRYIRSFRPWKYKVIPFSRFDGSVVLACATYGVRQYRQGVLPRDAVMAYKVGWTPFS